jgi:hypothetical protein
MISVPFETANSIPEDVLGIPFTWERGELGNLKDWTLVAYNPETRQWDDQVNDIEAGKGYWLYLARPHLTDMSEDAYVVRDWVGSQGFQVSLKQGWNLVGNPFVYAMTMGEIRFYHRSYGVLDYDQAVAQGLISRSVFAWNTTFQRWDLTTRRTAQFRPWQGYYLRVYKPDLTMLVTPASQIGASIGGSVPIDDGDDGGGGTPPTP